MKALSERIRAILFVSIAGIVLLCISSGAIAMLLGFLLTLLLQNPFATLSKKLINTLLKVAIIGLGFGISLEQTLAVGSDSLLLIFSSITFVIILGLVLIRLLKLDQHLGYLLASGTSICGGSAIAAISPIIKAKHGVISVAIALVFLLNSVALLIFPFLGNYLQLNPYQYGLWCAVAIHDTSSVLGAALVFGDEAVQIATMVKLSRTLWIIPLSIFTAFFFRSDSKRISPPYFILGFVASMLLNSYGLVSTETAALLTTISKRLLLLTLFLVGSVLTIGEIKKIGIKPFLFACVLWVSISVFSLVYILYSS